jgi:hypothetical protein
VEEDGLHFLFGVLFSAAAPKEKPHTRVAATTLLAALCTDSEEDLASYHANIIQTFLSLFHAPQPAVVRAGWAALDALIKGLPKERYLLHVTWLREQVAAVGEEFRASERAKGNAAPGGLPGLCLPKGLAPLTAVYLHGLMTGTPDLREASAAALGEAIELTTAAALKPFVIQITGPLIRIVGDRFPWGVKAAILHTLTLLIRSSALLLKPFVPQLQTTFVRALSDATRLVRMRGATALAQLVGLSARVEPLVTELANTLGSAESGVQYALLSALAGVFRGMAKPVSEATLDRVQAEALERLLVEEQQIGEAAAALLGALGRWRPLTLLLEAAEERSQDSAEEWKGQLAELNVHLALLRGLKAAAVAEVLPSLMASAMAAAASERIDLRQPAAHALARIAAAQAEPDAEGDEAADEEEAAQVGAAQVSKGVVDALGALLGDRILEVRCARPPARPRGPEPAAPLALRCACRRCMRSRSSASCAPRCSARPRPASRPCSCPAS